MNHSLRLLLCSATLVLSSQAGRSALVFSEDFSGLTNGAAITTSNTDFTFTRLTSASTFTGSITASNPGSFSGASMNLLSSGYSSAANYNGVGANNLTSSSIYTMSLDLTSSAWSASTALYLLVGAWDGTSGQQIYNPDGVLNAAGVTPTTMSDQSLFGLRILGGGSSANIQTVVGGAFTNTGVTLLNNTLYSLRFIANGSGSAITVGSNTINAGQMGIYVNNLFVTTAGISDNVDATAFRIFGQGFSTGNIQLGVEIDNINLWNSAVVPEPSTAALLLGATGALVAWRSRKQRLSLRKKISE